MANFNPDNLVAQAAILLTDRRTADAGAKLTEARALVRARRVGRAPGRGGHRPASGATGPQGVSNDTLARNSPDARAGQGSRGGGGVDGS